MTREEAIQVLESMKSEEKIEALKDLANYMADHVVKLEAENSRLYWEIIKLSIKNRILEIEAGK